MKKAIVILVFMVITLGSFAQQSDSAKAKLYTLKGDRSSYELLISLLDKSNASHMEVEAVKAWIIGQINSQIVAEPVADRPKPKATIKH